MNKINVIIPAAGEATRLRPITSNMSKAMVPINGKPVIDYIIEYLDGYDVNEIVVVRGKNNDLAEYIEKKYPHVKLAYQSKPVGPLDAIMKGFFVIDDPSYPTVVWLGDTIVTEDLPLGEDFFSVAEDVEDQSQWCMFSKEEGFKNKPKEPLENGKALIGVYSFSSPVDFAESMMNSKPNAEISTILEFCNIDQPIVTKEWYDMGNFRTYYETSAKLLTHKARAFNEIEADTFLGTLRKTSEEYDKLIPEIEWYQKLNEKQKLFVPNIIDHCVYYSDDGFDRAELEMTYESGILLSDLLVYDNLPITTWDFILDKIFRIMHEVFYKEDTPNIAKLKNMYVTKTVDRLRDSKFFTREEYNYLVNLGEEAALTCASLSSWSTIIHGDLHTGNIIFEPISGKMKLIDPRGDFGGCRPCTEGDRNYDMYKLAHDLYWGYNHMVAGLEHTREDIKELFVEKLKEYGYIPNQILKGGLLLLATCIPLHYDDPTRQKKFEQVVKDGLIKL